MLLTPADRGPAAQPDAGRDAQTSPWLAAPVSALSVPVSPRDGEFARAGGPLGPVDGLVDLGLADASVRQGGCFVRPLPLDISCAGAARRFFREALAGSDLNGDLIHDGVTMASELAANTMNAHGNIEYAGQGHRPVSGVPEFWLYLRTCGSGRELVCKIFDSEPGWDAGEPLPVGAAVPAGPDSIRGRGLQMVAGLSAGRWGHHLSRGRLGAWKVQGKAVWFALRIPPGSSLAVSERVCPKGSRAIAELATGLADRGLGAGLVPVADPGGDLAVLSVSRQLTIWCRGDVIWWQEPDGGYDRLTAADLVEVTERIVCAHEELLSAECGEPAGMPGPESDTADRAADGATAGDEPAEQGEPGAPRPAWPA
jgi:hypothetical protein